MSLTLEITKFWFVSERYDDRRNKKYGLNVRFLMRVKNKLDHRSVVDSLRSKGYSQADTFGAAFAVSDELGMGICGSVTELVTKPSFIPDSSQVIEKLGGLDKIRQDFIDAANIGLVNVELVARSEMLASQARSIYQSYWSYISDEARREIEYKRRLEELREEFRGAAVTAANKLFYEYPDSTGIMDNQGKEYTCEPEALKIARKKILEHAEKSTPDSFFERSGSDSISPNDFMTAKQESDHE